MKTQDKIQRLIEHYNNIVNNINSEIERSYCVTFIRQLETLLDEPAQLKEHNYKTPDSHVESIE